MDGNVDRPLRSISKGNVWEKVENDYACTFRMVIPFFRPFYLCHSLLITPIGDIEKFSGTSNKKNNDVDDEKRRKAKIDYLAMGKYTLAPSIRFGKLHCLCCYVFFSLSFHIVFICIAPKINVHVTFHNARHSKSVRCSQSANFR